MPDDRLTFYSAVNQPPEWVIEQWVGLVQNIVEEDDGSHLVTVVVYPRFQVKETTLVVSGYREQYLVSGDAVTYRGFLDPFHEAGKMPSMIVN